MILVSYKKKDIALGKRRNMDPEDMEMLYEKHRNRIYQKAKNNSVNEYIVEEMVQEAFLRLYCESTDIPTEAVDKWLSVTVEHLIIDYVRHYYREELVNDSGWEARIEKLGRDFEKNFGENPEETLFRELKDREYHMFLKEFWEDLYSHNQQWHQALWLTCVQKKSRQEVAEVMDVSKDSVRGLLYRVRQWISCNYGQKYLQLRNDEWCDETSRQSKESGEYSLDKDRPVI